MTKKPDCSNKECKHETVAIDSTIWDTSEKIHKVDYSQCESCLKELEVEIKILSIKPHKGEQT